MIVTDPGRVPLVVTWQLPAEERTHVEVKVTEPVPVCVKVTVPVGEWPTTCAVQVIDADAAKDDWVHTTVATVVTFVMVTEVVPELSVLWVSPE